MIIFLVVVGALGLVIGGAFALAEWEEFVMNTRGIVIKPIPL